MPSINPDRFRNDFDALAQIGSTGDGGVNRPALSEAHLEARRWWIARAAEAGLETRIDGAGNHSAILRSPDPDARTLLLGSHTDSVPSGGRFDGALGVIAALEALRTIQDAGITLPVHLEAIDFTDEEGALVGLTGSGALAEQLTVRSFENPRSGRTRWEASLARAGLTEAGILSARRDPKSLAGYLELHIEQGPRLFATGVDIGVVSGIVGIQSYRVTYRGEANHAGTTPMETRRDASLGASAFVLTARDLVMKNFPGCVVNVGQMALRPGAFNIVPGVAELSLEFRAPEPERLAQLGTALLQLAELVHVLTLDETGREQEGSLPDTEIGATLARHRVNVTLGKWSAKESSAADELRRAAVRKHAELLVMGAYGHSRFNELVFGGATRGMLKKMTMPVLFSH